jgi:hypothetical protein
MEAYFNDKNLEYLVKRWTKISTAIYACTNHVKDNDQIKWSVRNRALDIVSFIYELADIYDGQKNFNIDSTIKEINMLALEIILAGDSGVIKQINASLIKDEINRFKLELVEYRDKDAIISPLQKDFMKVETPKVSFPDFNKIDNKSSNNLVIKDNKGHMDTKGQSKGHVLDNIRQKRRNSIVSLLKNRSNLSIKDFSIAIKDCSEKTIQRELNSMVEEGVLYRVGNRRWSTYSLVGNNAR